MMPARHQGLLRLFIACALPLLALQSAAAADWQLEKVVELSRHGIRPPTAGNREAIEAAPAVPLLLKKVGKQGCDIVRRPRPAGMTG